MNLDPPAGLSVDSADLRKVVYKHLYVSYGFGELLSCFSLFFKGDSSDYELLKHQLVDPEIKVSISVRAPCGVVDFASQ